MAIDLRVFAFLHAKPGEEKPVQSALIPTDHFKALETEVDGSGKLDQRFLNLLIRSNWKGISS